MLSVRVMLVPVHRDVAPFMLAGVGITVTIVTAVLAQPDPPVTVYEMTSVPAVTPVTMPVLPTIVAPVAPALHTPPETASVSVILLPTHTADGPLTAPTVAGGLTVTIVVTVLPETVYEIVAVPDATPVTTPVEGPTVAMPVAPLFHVPPVLASERVVVAPTHTEAGPVITLEGVKFPFIDNPLRPVSDE